MPGWRNSTRRQRLPKNWPAIRQRILDRDHHQCQWVRADTGHPCGLPANQVDHIIPDSQGGSNADTNLQALCPWHHQRKSSSEGGRGNRQAGRKPKHPGLI